MIASLVNDPHFDSPSLRYKSTQREVRSHPDSSHKVFLEQLGPKLPEVMKWLNSWLGRHSTVEKMVAVTPKSEFVGIVARTFLGSSLCILPQHRGLLGQASAHLDLNKAEHMLIRASQRSLSYFYFCITVARLLNQITSI